MDKQESLLEACAFSSYFGVLKDLVMRVKWYPKGTSFGRTTKKMKNFYDTISANNSKQESTGML